MENRNVDEKPALAAADLDAWSAETWTDGIQINELKELDKFSVETMHHMYEITVIDPHTGEVMIRGGECFPVATSAHVSGASLHFSFIKLRGIYVGLHIELSVNGRRIVTSRVRSIRHL
jgi:hypothetical protein